MGFPLYRELFFKIDPDLFFFKFADCGCSIHRISSESRYGFHQLQVNMSGKAVLQHMVETLPVVRTQTGDTIIHVDFHELPARMICDIFRRSRSMRRDSFPSLHGLKMPSHTQQLFATTLPHL